MYKHEDFPNYSSDENGCIYGVKGKLKPFLHHTGYLVFTARYCGVQRQFRAHRFIMECLQGKSDKVVNHIDGVKTNNHPNNLEYVTCKENTKHAYRLGLATGRSGEDNSASKLTNEEATQLIIDLVGGISNTEAGLKSKLSSGYISLIRHKRRWKELWSELESSETIPSGVRCKRSGSA